MKRVMKIIEAMSPEGGDVGYKTINDLIKDVFGQFGGVKSDLDEETMAGSFDVTGDDWKAVVKLAGDTSGKLTVYDLTTDPVESIVNMDLKGKDIEEVLSKAFGTLAGALE